MNPTDSFFAKRLTIIEKTAIVALAVSPLALMAADKVGDCQSTSGQIDMSCDEGTFRRSISAYYEMVHYQWYFVVLVLGAALLAMNGLLRKNHWWNALAGALLLGVVLVDKDGISWLHDAFAYAFFITNVAIFLGAHWFEQTPKGARNVSTLWKTRELKLRLGLTAAVIGAWVLGQTDVLSTFYVEWASLVAVCIHFYRDQGAYHDDPVSASAH